MYSFTFNILEKTEIVSYQFRNSSWYMFVGISSSPVWLMESYAVLGDLQSISESLDLEWTLKIFLVNMSLCKFFSVKIGWNIVMF